MKDKDLEQRFQELNRRLTADSVDKLDEQVRKNWFERVKEMLQTHRRLSLPLLRYVLLRKEWSNPEVLSLFDAVDLRAHWMMFVLIKGIFEGVHIVTTAGGEDGDICYYNGRLTQMHFDRLDYASGRLMKILGHELAMAQGGSDTVLHLMLDDCRWPTREMVGVIEPDYKVLPEGAREHLEQAGIQFCFYIGCEATEDGAAARWGHWLTMRGDWIADKRERYPTMRSMSDAVTAMANLVLTTHGEVQ